jgi:hypothetical protein
MSSGRDNERGQPTPATARDGTRVEGAPDAVRVPRRDTDPVSGPPDESGVSARGVVLREATAPGNEAPHSAAPTPRNVETQERSAPTVRRADRISRGVRPEKPPPAPAERADEASETTLLSAPAPADHFEVDVERRLEESERRLDQLEADLAHFAEPRPPAERRLAENPLFWIVFLLAVAVAWLLFHAAH